MIRYDIQKGVGKIKTKTFVAISTLGLILGGGGLSLAIFGTAHATSPSLWQIQAPNPIVFNCGNTDYNHTLNTVSEDSTGVFNGTGSYVADPTYTWSTTGNVSGNSIVFTVVYDASSPNPGYTLHGNGTIAPDGSMSGSVDNNCSTFTMPAGSATLFSDRSFDAAKNKNLNPHQCSVTKHNQEVVDVSFKLVNDYDSAVGGNAWANDTINRHLDIWNTGGNNYCAIVSDAGSIVTFAGNSPNGTGIVDAGIKGSMDGGYRTTSFTGTFVGNANYHTHGNLGTFDLGCTGTAPGYDATCTGAHPSFSSYFSGDTSNVNLAWWGWEYNTCQNGSWINSIDANIGDITGNAPTGRDKDKCHADNDKHHHDHDGDRDHHNNFDRHDNDKHSGPRD